MPPAFQDDYLKKSGQALNEPKITSCYKNVYIKVEEINTLQELQEMLISGTDKLIRDSLLYLER